VKILQYLPNARKMSLKTNHLTVYVPIRRHCGPNYWQWCCKAYPVTSVHGRPYVNL
jgi:hypothetical protein